MDLPKYVFKEMGKRSAKATKNKFKTVDKYKEEMTRRANVRWNKSQEQAEKEIIEE